MVICPSNHKAPKRPDKHCSKHSDTPSTAHQNRGIPTAWVDDLQEVREGEDPAARQRRWEQNLLALKARLTVAAPDIATNTSPLLHPLLNPLVSFFRESDPT